ncbi:MAG: GAF domain-containing protein [Balneolales bacterium]|nr:GAF domain-containing protein [Balneolales bacterium]
MAVNSTAEPLLTSRSLADRKREDRALSHFKETVGQLVHMLRVAFGSETAYMYWVNRQRRQFVLEACSTTLDDVVFQDRVNFADHFLSDWSDLTQDEVLEVGGSVLYEDLKHHIGESEVGAVIILPFVNNRETVALTVIEIEHADLLSESQGEVAAAYHNALSNMLNTYLELSDLIEEETKWSRFDETLAEFSEIMDMHEILGYLVNKSSAMVPNGGSALLARGADGWHVLLTAGDSRETVPAGLRMTENSQASLALRTGKAQFALHFNSNPKRISPAEHRTEGASLAIPVQIHDRRQAVVVVWDENPLLFRESSIHMFETMARVAGLRLSQARFGIKNEQDMLSTDSGAYSLEVLESLLKSKITRAKEGVKLKNSFLIFISPKDYQNLRTRYRLEHLKNLQAALVKDINPNEWGLPGLVTFYADSLYAVYVQAEDESIVAKWLRGFNQRVTDASLVSDSYIGDIDFFVSITALKLDKSDPFDILQAAKREFNEAVRSSRTLSQMY